MMARRIFLAALAATIVATALPVVAAQAATRPASVPVKVVMKRTGPLVRVTSHRLNWAPVIAAIRRFDRKHHLKFRGLAAKPKHRRAARAATTSTVVLSRSLGARMAVAADDETDVTGETTGFDCSVPVDKPTKSTNDSDTFTSSQGASTVGGDSITQTCSGIDPALAGSSSTATDDCTTYTTDGGNTYEGNGLYATFSDGEYAGYCNDPDSGATLSYSLNQNTTLSVGQGFSCEVPVGTGSNGDTQDNLHTTDSIEGVGLYSSLDPFSSFTSVTTVCVGQLPQQTARPNLDTGPVYHTVACEQAGGAGVVTGPVQGYGITVTFPDGQYSETCNTPNYDYFIDND
jgi:hypothetical protein